jgi:hypothetical protein
MTALFSTITGADWVRSLSNARPHRSGQRLRIENQFSRAMRLRLSQIAAGEGTTFEEFPRVTESTANKHRGWEAATPDAPTEGDNSAPSGPLGFRAR